MKYTNRNNLPQPLVNVLENDTYSKGAARISITGLMTPPRIALLRQKYHDLIEEDVSENIWAILGRAIHKVLEAGADEEHLSEERLFAEIDGWIVSGALDLQRIGENKVAIVDYKLGRSNQLIRSPDSGGQGLGGYRSVDLRHRPRLVPTQGRAGPRLSAAACC